VGIIGMRISSMTKTHAEFLEELKQESFGIIKNYYNYDHFYVKAKEDLLKKIEQFQAEQKQVSDERNNEDNK
jgi:hypothetical protein